MRTRGVLCLLVPLLGCAHSEAVGAGQTQEPMAPAAAEGNEATPAEPGGAPGSTASAERSAAPARMSMRALVDGVVVPAHVRVLSDAGETLAEGEAGATLTLPAGQYRAEIAIRDAAALADKPVQVRQVFLRAGQDTAIDASFPWAKVSLNVLAHGRPQRGVVVKLLRGEQVVAELKSGAPLQAVTPGKYDAEVMFRGAALRVQGLQLLEGATQVMPVNVR